MPFLDLSHTVMHNLPVFPGEKPPSLLPDDLPEDTGYITYRLETNFHTGTHIDAPFHVLSGSKTIDAYPVDAFFGKAMVLDVRGEKLIRMRGEWNDLFCSYPVILFCTGHSSAWKAERYYLDYPVFQENIAIALKESQVRIVGFDTPSPDVAPYPFHSIFLHGDRFMVENLTNLELLLGKQDIEFMAFPLKLQAEASLVRAVAKYSLVEQFS